MYINNVDYYQPDKLKVLSPERIANAAKCAGIEPKIVFKNIFVHIVYNQKHQLAIAKQVADFGESRSQDIRLVTINNLTKKRIKVQELRSQYFEGSNRNTLQGLRQKQNSIDLHWRYQCDE